MNLELDSHVIAFLKIFCLPDTGFDGHNVAAIFGKQGSLPLGFANANFCRYHAPAIRYES